MVYEVSKEQNGNALTITYNGKLIAAFNLCETFTGKASDETFYHLVTVYQDGRANEEVIAQICHKAGNSSLYGEER